MLGPEKAINLNFKRVQFTTDLLPSHIIGMEIIIQNKINFI
ncbi:AAA family ATPase [Campylobacter sputorum]